MRYLKIILFDVSLLLLLSGCVLPNDYRMKKAMLIEPPDKLVYIAGQDKELDLSGGRVIKFADFDHGVYTLVRLNQFRLKYTQTDADFNREGVYLVNITKRRWWFFEVKYFQFTVQAINPGEYEMDTSGPGDDFTFTELDPTYCENATAYMISPPDNIIYPVGYEGEIGLEGVMLKPVGPLFAKTYDIAELDYTLETDADFNTPGSYIVRVNFTDNRGRDLWFCFTVAVAERVSN